MQKEFNKILDNLLKANGISEKVFAVGVSGGADSLALALLLKSWGKAKIVTLTVDHGLRKESSEEAFWVSEVMKKFDIEHHILKWEGEKPSNGMEEAARNARYDLLEKWCVKNKVESLFVAHHKFDQAETFIMRLQRGSGVSGLASMLPVSDRGSIKIIRPLLGFNPTELKEYLIDKKVKWVEDPHNSMDDFLRVRIRKMLPELDEKIGLSVDRLADTAKRMARARDYLEKQTDKFIKNNVKSFEDKAYAFSVKSFGEQHEEIALRILAELLQKTGKKIYSPRMENLERLYNSMFDEDFSSQTLSDCEVIKSQNRFWIVPECKEKDVISKKQWEDFIEKNPQYKKVKLPHKLRLCLMS